MKDEKIIELYFERSEDAIAQTDKKYGRRCRGMAYNILCSREDSEECVSDTYLKIWNAVPPARPENLGAFVMRTLRNTALNLYKTKNRLRAGGGLYSVELEEISGCLPAGESVENTVDRKAVIEAVEKFLSSLSREKQIMFIRRYFYCCPYSEIAAALNTTEGRVKMTLKRIREKLRVFLEKEGIEI